jgi:paraquat-inducible protein B
VKRKASPTRIGLFMLGAIALLVTAVALVTGGGLFVSRERALAYFEGSVYGLQIGAPVVFRGVRLGSVVGIGVVYQGRPGQYAIPVELEIERDRIEDVQGGNGSVTVADLVAQGLTAQLSTQSLLTGLLYVDLDLGRDRETPAPGAAASAPAGAHGLPVIPTVATPVQALQKQLRNLDVEQLLSDVAAVAAGARQFVANPRLQHTMDELAQASSELRQLLARVDKRVGPLADALQGTLAETRRTAATLGGEVTRAGQAVDRVGQAADRVSATMGRYDRIAESAQPALDSVQRAAADLALTAQALRSASADDAGVLPQIERAAQEMARASRAVRDLADLLERQPEALIRGRTDPP